MKHQLCIQQLLRIQPAFRREGQLCLFAAEVGLADREGFANGEFARARRKAARTFKAHSGLQPAFQLQHGAAQHGGKRRVHRPLYGITGEIFPLHAHRFFAVHRPVIPAEHAPDIKQHTHTPLRLLVYYKRSNMVCQVFFAP